MMALVGSSQTSNIVQPVQPFQDVTAVGVINLASRKFTIATGIVSGAHYKFYLRPYNGVDYGGYSVVSERIITAVVPSEPFLLSKLSASKSSVSLQWAVPVLNGGAYIIKYAVYSNSGSGDDFSLVGYSNSLSYTHANLSPSGITIAYKVTAVNDVGES